jgi:dTMP kinase
MFITFEGGEGSGKSTAIKHIVSKLEALGYEVVLSREPGGTKISEEIRNIILDKSNTEMDPMTEALLYAASRRQHIQELILPSLKAGKIVLCDRYLDSSLAYQGAARGLGVDRIYALNQYATEGLLPDITIFFKLLPQVGLARIEANDNREVNRLDVEKLSFHQKVYEAFNSLSKQYPDRYVTIDASLDPESVAKLAYEAIEKRLG